MRVYSVLKDEASTAIYGDKAKHGVILITLKGKDVQNVLSLSALDPEDGVKVVGVVKDHLDKPLAGASVFISGTVSGTMSDAYGRFVLLAPKNAMLRISYTGMTTVEKAVAPEVNVTLNRQTKKYLLWGATPTDQCVKTHHGGQVFYPRSEGWKKTGKYRFERTLSII